MLMRRRIRIGLLLSAAATILIVAGAIFFLFRSSNTLGREIQRNYGARTLALQTHRALVDAYRWAPSSSEARELSAEDAHWLNRIQEKRLHESLHQLDSLHFIVRQVGFSQEESALYLHAGRLTEALEYLERHKKPLEQAQFPAETLKWLNNLRDHYKQELAQRQTELHNQNQLVYLIVAGAGLYVVFINLMLYDQVPRFILDPLQQFSDKISRIAEGDFMQKVEAPRDTELGRMAESFNQMAARLHDYYRENLARLTAQKKRMEHIINSLNDPLFVFDEQDTLLLLNRAAIEVMGGPADRWEGHTMEALKRISSEFRVFWGADEEQHEQGHSGAVHLRQRQGRDVYYQRQYIPVENHHMPRGREVAGTILVLQDVTAYRELDKAKTKFIATLSHELKTPLSSLNVSLNLLARPTMGGLNPQQEEIVELMRYETRRLLKMVGELLTLSRIERGKLEVKPAPLSLRTFCQAVYNGIAPQFEEKAIHLEWHFPDAQAQIYADHEKLSWALTNLLTNALRYSPEQGTVEIHIDAKAEYWCFHVLDRGPGVPQAFRRQLFSPYFQISPSQRASPEEEHHGLGLGLSIAREVVEAHGGQIAVKQRPDGGSHFWFTIPRQ